MRLIKFSLNKEFIIIIDVNFINISTAIDLLPQINAGVI